ncbi:MAG: hypothetical protein ACPLXP_01125 [Microgenomates group bacterium]
MNKEKQIKRPKLLIIITTLVLLLALAQLVVSHNLATLGGKLRQLEEKAAQLEEETRILTEEISSSTSLSKISLKAEELGFVRTTAVLHLTPQIPVALK